MTTREKAEQALKDLPEEKVPAALEAVREARDELAAGVSTISHEEIKREFGLE